MVLFVFAAGVFAQNEADWQTKIEEKLGKIITTDFQDTTLSKALDFVRSTAELNIVLDAKAADLAEKRLTLKIKKVHVESAIAWTARLMGLEYAVRDEAVYLAKRDDMPIDWRGEMQERYRKMVASGQEAWLADIEARLDRTVKADFRNDQLPAVIEFLAAQSGVNIVLDYHLVGKTKPIKLQAEMSLKNLLNWATRLADAKYVIRDEVIYVANDEGMRQLRLDTGESLIPGMFRRPVTFHFAQTPVREAIDRLSRYSNVKIELAGLEPNETLPVTASGEGVELNLAVRMVMNQTKRAYAISYRGKSIAIVVSPKSETKPPADAR